VLSGCFANYETNDDWQERFSFLTALRTDSLFFADLIHWGRRLARLAFAGPILSLTNALAYSSMNCRCFSLKAHNFRPQHEVCKRSGSTSSQFATLWITRRGFQLNEWPQLSHPKNRRACQLRCSESSFRKRRDPPCLHLGHAIRMGSLYAQRQSRSSKKRCTPAYRFAAFRPIRAGSNPDLLLCTR